VITVIFENLYFIRATKLRCGGIFSNNFITNFSQNVQVKIVQNRSIFGDDMNKNLRLTFLATLDVCVYYFRSTSCAPIGTGNSLTNHLIPYFCPHKFLIRFHLILLSL